MRIIMLGAPGAGKGVLAKMAGDLDTLEDLHELLEASIEEDPPIPIEGFSEVWGMIFRLALLLPMMWDGIS